MKDALATLARGEDLAPALMEETVGAIMDGQATEAQIGAFLIGDSFLMGAICGWCWIEVRKLQKATGNWEDLRDEWKRRLDLALKGVKMNWVTWGIMLIVGLVNLGVGLATGRESSIMLGSFMSVVSVLVISVYSRRIPRWRRERDALEELG